MGRGGGWGGHGGRGQFALGEGQKVRRGRTIRREMEKRIEWKMRSEEGLEGKKE
jgi:hypothetical protein